MDGILEYQRRAHEVVDHLEKCIVQAMLEQPRSYKARLLQDHYISSLLDRILENSKRLTQLYAAHSVRDPEITSITASDDNQFCNFYDQLKTLKDRHRRLGATLEDVVETTVLVNNAKLSDEALSVMFSGEEALGRYLDLHSCYQLYVNLKEIKRVDYLRYLEELDNFTAIPLQIKSTPSYKKYVNDLLSYIQGFISRSKPLFNSSGLIAETASRFEDLWRQSRIPGWEDLARNEKADLYCGPCSKQFFNESVYKSHLTGKKHAKAAAHSNGMVKAEAPTSSWAYEVARNEALIASLLLVLGKSREDTRSYVEAKQSRSSDERALDLEREDQAQTEGDRSYEAAEAEDDDYDPKIYNPLNLPLDWDGKPIPYWLWKLHGLGTGYSCEICGNHVYMGRKAFDQHFYEWRHSHGLKCLGIPNTRHFFQVTSLKDAVTLWDKLKAQAKSENFRADLMEEFEDQHGNVYNRKTYEDLKRQGII